MATQLRRLVRGISDNIWVLFIGLALVGLIIFSLTRETSGATTTAIQPTLDHLATQDSLTGPAIAAQLTLTPPEARLTEAAPTLVLLGQQQIIQHAAAAEADAQQDELNKAAIQAAGPPNTEGCSDAITAWMPVGSGGGGILTLLYAQAVVPTRLRVYQTYNPGLISLITFTDLYGDTFTIYQATPQVIGQCPFVLDVEIADVETPGGRITIIATGPVQIDAVELSGVKY